MIKVNIKWTKGKQPIVAGPSADHHEDKTSKTGKGHQEPSNNQLITGKILY